MAEIKSDAEESVWTPLETLGNPNTKNCCNNNENNKKQYRFVTIFVARIIATTATRVGFFCISYPLEGYADRPMFSPTDGLAYPVASLMGGEWLVFVDGLRRFSPDTATTSRNTNNNDNNNNKKE